MKILVIYHYDMLIIWILNIIPFPNKQIKSMFKLYPNMDQPTRNFNLVKRKENNLEKWLILQIKKTLTFHDKFKYTDSKK